MTGRNIGASVRARLLARAQETRQDFSLVLTRYAIERLLYRIGVSRHADHFLLKGALLFDLWFDVPHRPTRDVDLLGFGSAALPLMESTFKEISAIAEDDGVTFDPDTVRATEIRKDANYAGLRVGLLGSIDGARCQLQIDIGWTAGVQRQGRGWPRTGQVPWEAMAWSSRARRLSSSKAPVRLPLGHHIAMRLARGASRRGHAQP